MHVTLVLIFCDAYYSGTVYLDDLVVGIWGSKNKNFLPNKPELLQL